jgi:molybdenum cofactor biosynthesis protein A
LETLFDNHGRPINYLRLAVTDRCNLRCFYCMPSTGIDYLPKKALLTYEEIQRLVKILAELGISKVRLTGGEPFVRNDIVELIKMISDTKGIEEVHITTNGILAGKHIADLVKYKIKSVNLSLDTLDAERFKLITRRDEFRNCLDTLHALRAHQIPVKINSVVMADKNIEDIIPLAELSRDNISVRFIEEMPFNGEGAHYQKLEWTYNRILDHLRSHFKDLVKIQDALHSTSYNFQVPGYKGTIGVIPAFSRTFCGTCNRIRLTAQGTLKTCLYDNGVLDLRKLLRTEKDDNKIKEQLLVAFQNRHANGLEAERHREANKPVVESMSTIGG